MINCTFPVKIITEFVTITKLPECWYEYILSHHLDTWKRNSLKGDDQECSHLMKAPNKTPGLFFFVFKMAV